MQRPANITIGQEVFIAKPGSWITSFTLGTVCKITPSGQVTVGVPDCGFKPSEQHRFGKDDYALGEGSHRRPYLAWNVAEIKAAKAEQERMRNVSDVLRKVRELPQFKDTYGEDTAREQIAALRAIADEADRALGGTAPAAPAPAPAPAVHFYVKLWAGEATQGWYLAKDGGWTTIGGAIDFFSDYEEAEARAKACLPADDKWEVCVCRVDVAAPLRK